jgi:lipoprotein-anchoring transpeptidase ErfK/SrfK
MSAFGVVVTARRSRRALLVVAVSLAALIATGCQSSNSPTTSAKGPNAIAAELIQPSISIDPATSTTGVRPSAIVHVEAKDGKLTKVVVVDQKSRRVKGTISADGTTYASTGKLQLARHYVVRAFAVGMKGTRSTQVSYFDTIKPKGRLTTAISPLGGSTMGVGMPIIVRFSHPVHRRAVVERRLTVQTDKPIVGAWNWISSTEVHYRPRTYWPPYTHVQIHVHLMGVNAGHGIWGHEARTVAFDTGPSMVSVVNVKKDTLTVHRNGKVIRVIPVTTGKADFLTRNGIKVILEKFVSHIMDSRTVGIPKSSPDFYRLDVPYAMRVTWSGEFVHAAPWSVASQGRENVSHGCVGMSMSNGIWLFNRSLVGDVVQVVGSPRPLEPGNGYTDWNVPWSAWKAGSALHS